jgi:hypothetical protein
MSNQNDNNNNNTGNDSNDNFEDMELYEEGMRAFDEFMKDVESESNREFVKENFGTGLNKRSRDRMNDYKEDDHNEEPEPKRRKIDHIPDRSPSEDWISDEISNDGEERTKGQKIAAKVIERLDEIRYYKDVNKILSDKSIQDLVNKLDNNEMISEEEFEHWSNIDKLLDKGILTDRDSLRTMEMYKTFSTAIEKEIVDNHAKIEKHKKKIADYFEQIAELPLEELSEEKSEMSSNNDSSDSNNDSPDSNNDSPDSNNDSNFNDNSNNSNNYDSDNPSKPDDPRDGSDDNHPSDSDDSNDNDEFDDFPPSFDFDDF